MDVSTDDRWVYFGHDGEVFGPDAYLMSAAYNLARATVLSGQGEGEIVRASDGIPEGVELVLGELRRETDGDAIPSRDVAVFRAVSRAVAALRARWFTEVFGVDAGALPRSGENG